MQSSQFDMQKYFMNFQYKYIKDNLIPRHVHQHLYNIHKEKLEFITEHHMIIFDSQ